MGRVNYAFEKRKRDLEKQQKKEAKRRKKLERAKGRGDAPVTPPPQTP